MSGIRVVGSLVVSLCMLLLAPGLAASAERRPVLFVHGIEGTGAQFQSQALRFTSNGYPADWIDQVDYDSTRGAADRSAVHAAITEKIEELRRRTGVAKVDVVAHSLGTLVMESYLTRPAEGEARRELVGKYVNIDGQADNPGVPTLALWAGRQTDGGEPATMPGAENVTLPNQTHVQACTSREAFAAMYRFLTGEEPKHGIVAEPGRIQVSGRALSFPQNAGLAGATVEAWAIDERGHRVGSAPAASTVVTDGAEGGGAFGPLTLESGRPYEFAVLRDGRPDRHTYQEPFVRSDHTVRLLASDVTALYSGGRAGGMSVSTIRYKELWGDVPGESDVLTMNGLSVCTAALCPWRDQVNAFFAFDRNSDGQSDLSSPDPVLGSLPFMSAADVYLPASSDATGTATFELSSRGGPTRTVRTTNWDAAAHSVTVQWSDFDHAEVEAPPAAQQASPPRCAARTVVLRVPRSRAAGVRRIEAWVGGRRVGRSTGSRAVRVRVPAGARGTKVAVRLRVTSRRDGRTRTTTLRRTVSRCR